MTEKGQKGTKVGYKKVDEMKKWHEENGVWKEKEER
jgi:hypothetical protein